jgi:hypothetical protein
VSARSVAAPDSGRPFGEYALEDMRLPKRLREERPPERRRRGFARIASGLLWAFTLGFVLGAVQIGKALWSHKVWMNYRGDVISQAAMRGELVFFIFGAIFCALLAGHWHRIRRRQS